jgi:poly-gamma-glutamate synthesis protein (capsule biosynthesis protein)
VIAQHPPPFASWASPVGSKEQAAIIAKDEWHTGCPVPFSGLRILHVTYVGFDGHAHPGQLVVNRSAVRPLTIVFRKLYAARFPIRHMRFSDEYGTRPKDGDITASMECRQAVPSPCSGGTGTGHWSEHAYGEAVDINPVENPYVVTRPRSAS